MPFGKAVSTSARSPRKSGRSVSMRLESRVAGGTDLVRPPATSLALSDSAETGHCAAVDGVRLSPSFARTGLCNPVFSTSASSPSQLVGGQVEATLSRCGFPGTRVPSVIGTRACPGLGPLDSLMTLICTIGWAWDRLDQALGHLDLHCLLGGQRSMETLTSSHLATGRDG